MQEYMELIKYIFPFVMVPFIGSILFSLILPPLGVVLSQRNESMLSIAIVPVGTAFLALGVLLGIPENNYKSLFAVILAGVSLCYVIFSLFSNSMRKKNHMLALMFAVGQGFTILFMALSSYVNCCIARILNGEILAFGEMDLIFVAFIVVFIAVFFFVKRGNIFTYAIDESMLNIRYGIYKSRSIKVVISGILIVAISGSIIWTGPILTAALLVIPQIINEKASTGVADNMVKSTFSSIVGVATGFVVSIIANIPPVPAIVLCITVVALFMRFFNLGLKKIGV